MKKNIFLRISLTLIALLMLISLFSVSAFASDMPAQNDSYPDEVVDWNLSDDGETLTNLTENTVYTEYKPRVVLEPVAEEIYCYSETLNVSGNGYNDVGHVRRPYNYNYAVWVNSYYEYYYVTEEGRAYLDSFIDGEHSSYYLCLGGDSYSKDRMNYEEYISKWDEDLKNGENVEKIDSRILDNCTAYYVYAFDDTGCFAYRYGVIYELYENEYWYVNLRKLHPSQLNEYGGINISSSVKVDMTHLQQMDKLYAKDFIYGEERYISESYTWEDDLFIGGIIHEDDAISFTLVFFWIGYAFFGFIFPLPFAIVGILLAFIKKLGRPKYWLTVSVLALLWLLIAIILAVVIIIVLVL